MMKSEAKKSEIKKCNVEFEWQMPNILYRKQTRYTRLKTMRDVKPTFFFGKNQLFFSFFFF